MEQEDYIKSLTKKFPAIKEIWLIGSRANNSENDNSDWDFFVFADQKTLDDLTTNLNFNKPNIDLLVIIDGNTFVEPWHNGEHIKHGSLSSWEWNRFSETEATYKATKLRDGDTVNKAIFNASIYEAKAIRVYVKSSD